MAAAVVIIPLAVEALCGAAGGVAIGRWLDRPGANARRHALLGGAGGLVLTWVAARMPGVGQFVGGVGSGLDTALQGTSGLTVTLLVGVGIAGLLGGVLAVLAGDMVRR